MRVLPLRLFPHKSRASASILALAAVALLRPTTLAADPPLRWEQWQRLEWVVDVGGPRSDGALVAMAAGRLSLVAPDGAITPFADGPDGYAGDPDSEQYFVVAPALPPQPAGCQFAPDDVLVLQLTAPPGIARVDRAGRSIRLVTISDVDTLSGIGLDTTGRFGYRLLVTAVRADHTALYAVDCHGAITTIAELVPTVEGGYAVAPEGFGPYAGDLIAADELSGQVWAIGPTGAARLVALPDLSAGGDTGVESIGFVPPGFGAGSTGAAYLADRGTPGNPFPGTDSILRLSAGQLLQAGVQPGDLLISTEGGGLTVAIRCRATCETTFLASAPDGAHIEGHIAVTP